MLEKTFEMKKESQYSPLLSISRAEQSTEIKLFIFIITRKTSSAHREEKIY